MPIQQLTIISNHISSDSEQIIMEHHHHSQPHMKIIVTYYHDKSKKNECESSFLLRLDGNALDADDLSMFLQVITFVMSELLFKVAFRTECTLPV